MTRHRMSLPAALLIAVPATVVMPVLAQVPPQYEELNRQLNGNSTVEGTEQAKSYNVLFDAYIEMSPPPTEIGEWFNLDTIHPGMDDWSAVSDWAESNPQMGEALIECKGRKIIGLPYGRTVTEPKYVQADLFITVGEELGLRDIDFRYQSAVETIAAYATAEMYRRLEAGQIDEGLEVAIAHLYVLRQFADRRFLAEKTHSINLLIDSLEVLRDAMYLYRDDITTAWFQKIARLEIPFLRPDKNNLAMPEADREVSEALLREVYLDQDYVDPERFATTFGAIQSADDPLTRFGAVRRWRAIADVHASQTASIERLTLVYDDWWRRWRLRPYDEILDMRTQYERTNPIRYAGVTYSMQNIESLFTLRTRLQAEVNGTAVAAGICGYRTIFGTYPNDHEKVYGQFVRKTISDVDPYDPALGNFRFIFLDNDRHAIDTPSGRIWATGCILYSRGLDTRDDRAEEHTPDGSAGDIVFWPPIKAKLREDEASS